MSSLAAGGARFLPRMLAVFALSAVAALGIAPAASKADAETLPLTIDTPANAVVCQPLWLTWAGGTAPYTVEIQPGGQPSAPALKKFIPQFDQGLWWTVDVPAGTSLGLTVRDETGAVAQSAPFTVNDGASTGCLQDAVE